MMKGRLFMKGFSITDKGVNVVSHGRIAQDTTGDSKKINVIPESITITSRGKIYMPEIHVTLSLAVA
jgi:hypothetical protein